MVTYSYTCNRGIQKLWKVLPTAPRLMLFQRASTHDIIS